MEVGHTPLLVIPNGLDYFHSFKITSFFIESKSTELTYQFIKIVFRILK